MCVCACLRVCVEKVCVITCVANEQIKFFHFYEETKRFYSLNDLRISQRPYGNNVVPIQSAIAAQLRLGLS